MILLSLPSIKNQMICLHQNEAKQYNLQSDFEHLLTLFEYLWKPNLQFNLNN